MKKTLLSLCLFAITTTASAWEGKNWMSEINGNTPMCNISLPGSHDSGTGHASSASLGKVQDLTITEQFEAGVRAFDYRVHPDGGNLPLYHGATKCNISFQQAMQALFDCLAANPTETVFVQMQVENGDGSGDNTFWNLVAAALAQMGDSKFVRWAPGLTLNECRGKVILVSRTKYGAFNGHGDTYWGFINWSSDNQALANYATYGNGEGNTIVSDRYEHNGQTDKNSATQQYFNAIASKGDSEWGICFVSGYQVAGITSSYANNAKFSNPYAAGLIDLNDPKPVGMIYMDFAGVDKHGSTAVKGKTLVDKIIDNSIAYNKKVYTPEAAGLSFVEHNITVGQSQVIGGTSYTKPCIVYTEENGSKVQHRLTVAPASNNASEFTQPYLNMATPNSVSISWKMKRAASNATVRYGTAEGSLTQSASATSTVIANNYVWHTATLEGLQPNTVYYYQVTAGGNTSAVYRFRTQPEVANANKLRILLIGDHQRNEHSDYEWLLQMAQEKAAEKWGEAPVGDQFAFLMNVGDQVDAADLSLYENVHLYKSSPVMSELPVMTCVGNHECKSAWNSGYDGDLTLYAKHYNYGELSYKGISSGTPYYYAYQAGHVLFIVLNSEPDYIDAAQKTWVRNIVKEADKDPDIHFIMSVQHRPVYAEQFTTDVSPWVRNEIMPILSSSKKHVVNCAGHHHLYARGQMTDYPVYHLISGGGVGTSATGYEQLWGTSADSKDLDEVSRTLDHWTYSIMEFDSDTRTFTTETYSIGNSRVALDNKLVDSFSINTTAEAPAKPQLTEVEAEITAPYVFTQEEEAGELNAVQWQIARDPYFHDIALNRILTADDFYGVDQLFIPKDLHAGLDKTSLTISKLDMTNGTYYLRCRNRSADLQWSEFSEAVSFTLTGQALPQVALARDKYKIGESVSVSFVNAPVGTNAWIGIYKESKAGSDGSEKWGYTITASGTQTHQINDAGVYYAVLFGDDGYNEISARQYFVVGNDNNSSQPMSFTTNKTVYDEGDPIVVSFSNAPNCKGDWIGLYSSYVENIKNATSHSYTYTNAGTNGSVTLNVTGNTNFTAPVEPGEYFVCYCSSGEYYIVASQTISVKEKITDITITDGEDYTSRNVSDCETLTYIRNFTTTNWQSLYVPFSMDVEEFSPYFEVAEINGIHQYDTNKDGVLDKTVVEFRRVTSGSTVANRPYLVKPLTTGPVEITLYNKTLAKAENASVDCWTTHELYTLTGVYSQKSLPAGTYGLTGGAFNCSTGTTTLNPGRIYMTITPRNCYGETPIDNAPAKINIVVDGDETGIETIHNSESTTHNSETYNLAGQKVGANYKGIVIKNGKKLLIH